MQFTLRERRQHRICCVRLHLQCVNTAALAFLAATALTPLEISGFTLLFEIEQFFIFSCLLSFARFVGR